MQIIKINKVESAIGRGFMVSLEVLSKIDKTSNRFLQVSLKKFFNENYIYKIANEEITLFIGSRFQYDCEQKVVIFYFFKKKLSQFQEIYVITFQKTEVCKIYIFLNRE